MKILDTRSRLLTVNEETLAQENLQYSGSGGISTNNRETGFLPAFLDTETGNIYRSRFPDGRPAPVHVLTGLPDDLIENSILSDGLLTIRHSVVSGFVLGSVFYTREEAANAIALKHVH